MVVVGLGCRVQLHKENMDEEKSSNENEGYNLWN